MDNGSRETQGGQSANQLEIERLRTELAKAQQEILELRDLDPRGNTDPLLEWAGRLKSRCGRSVFGRRLHATYRRIIRQEV